MSIEAGRAYFRQFGMEDRVQEFTVSSATVDLAAKALGVEGARIAKTLSFKTADGCMLILAAVAAMAEPSGTVMLYSSLKEKQLVAVKEAFEAKYPGIVMDYYQAGTGKIKTKIATEQQAGQVAADLLWVGDASDYLTFKEQGILEAYVSPESEKIPDAYKDSDDLYCGARLVVMGMAYNTQNVTEEEAPKHWKDLLNETFRDQIIMTDPTESGTTAYLVGALVNNEAYGWEFFEQLAAMGTELDSGTSGTHNNVASGGYKVCIAVDYVTQTLESQGSPIKFVYPAEDTIAISSPIALVKGCANPDNGKLLYDFILSEEGQTVLMKADCTPIRDGVAKEGALSASEIAAIALKPDEAKLAQEKQDTLDHFDQLFK